MVVVIKITISNLDFRNQNREVLSNCLEKSRQIV